ncbi:MAG: hypothetical protein CVV44_06665 [Spirochaetae bacterium HGW-Spirochaetae-1]|jgi:PAS domain S-box-containing protein|nr:MAG: hypothetical protein CVV44_06665 [Spirochaetae bacterium HGW-Spirochaetae-1]
MNSVSLGTVYEKVFDESCNPAVLLRVLCKNGSAGDLIVVKANRSFHTQIKNIDAGKSIITEYKTFSKIFTGWKSLAVDLVSSNGCTTMKAMNKDSKELRTYSLFSVNEETLCLNINIIKAGCISPGNELYPGTAAMYEEYNLLSAINSILIGVSFEDIITHWNANAEAVFQIKAHDAIGKNMNKIVIGLQWDWKEIYLGIAEGMTTGEAVSLPEITLTTSDGVDRTLGITISPIKSNDGRMRGFLIYGRDITEKKMMEMQILQDQKLKSIGELASGVAHEINTPMQYISDNTHFLKDSFSNILGMYETCLGFIRSIKTSSGESAVEEGVERLENLQSSLDIEFLKKEIPQAIDQSLEGINRVIQIVKSMKTFSHPGNDSKVFSNINKIIQDTITILRSEWKYDSDVETALDLSLPEILCFPAEISQVLLNMLVNASQAIKSSIAAGHISRGYIGIGTKNVGKSVEITISDNGIGITKANIPKIFDPFFTTKEVGQGTGQGLAISYAIVKKKHHGSIRLSSQENKGTTFFIRLPIDAQETNDGKDQTVLR